MAQRNSITSAIAADFTGRFPSSSELEAVSSWLREGQSRLSAAQVLTRNADELSENAVRSVSQKFPDAARASKSLFTFLPEGESHSFKGDIDILYRLLIYRLLVGNDNPEATFLDEILQQISCVIHESPEISPIWYTEALETLRNNLGLSGESAVEVDSYIDNVIAAFS